MACFTATLRRAAPSHTRPQAPAAAHRPRLVVEC
jgi:hypothetical protein